MNALEILENNRNKLTEFFEGIVSCGYYDGLSHQLYLDLDDGKVVEYTEASDSTWHEREDGSLQILTRVSGYCDIPEDERYTEGCDLNDYNFQEWLDEIEEKIEEILDKDGEWEFTEIDYDFQN